MSEIGLPRGYEVRPQQIRFIQEGRNVLSSGGIYMVCAPCGVGKTLASLLCMIPFLNENKLIVAYRTRSQLAIYLKELSSLSDENELTCVSLYSKKDMCPLMHDADIPYTDFLRSCRLLKRNAGSKNEPYCEYFGNLMQSDAEWYKEEITEMCRKFMQPFEIFERCRKMKICPHEGLKLILPHANVFLGTYSYILEQEIRDDLLEKMMVSLCDVSLIVDEAHNLPYAAREALSDRITKVSISRAIEEARNFHHRGLLDVIRILVELEQIFEDHESNVKTDETGIVSPSIIMERLSRITGMSASTIIDLLQEYGEHVMRAKERSGEKRIFSYVRRVGRFLENFFSSTDPQYVHLFSRSEREVALEYRNLDGREITDPLLRGVARAILMSGTLTPLDVYRDLLTREKERVITREFDLPFPKSNRMIIVARDVCSREDRRTEEMYRRYAEYIESVLRVNEGNVAVFFTSYEMMERVQQFINTSRDVLLEDRKTRIDEIANALLEHTNNVLYGVFGGKFSEGIDYPGEMLTCVVCAGFPYARWDEYQRELVRYTERQFPGFGRIYGYLTPAILRMLQACGRVHRSENDKGCIVVLDGRVRYPYIRRRLPLYFQREMRVVGSPEECSSLISRFWETHRIVARSAPIR